MILQKAAEEAEAWNQSDSAFIRVDLRNPRRIFASFVVNDFQTKQPISPRITRMNTDGFCLCFGIRGNPRYPRRIVSDRTKAFFTADDTDEHG